MSATANVEKSWLWIDDVPLFSNLPDSLKKILLRYTRVVSYKKNQVIFRPGESCQYFILVLQGAVRVRKNSADGREINLHRLKSGDFCEVSTMCFLADRQYCAEAVAEAVSKVVLVDKRCFNELLKASPEFQLRIYDVVNQNLNQLIHFVENVAFSSLELRLAERLFEASAECLEIKETHREIAADLGTSREVVSRMLKSFEHKKWVELKRGCIMVVDRPALDECVKENRV